MTNPPCFGIAGWKNSGKTSLLANLVKAMSDIGLTISTIKHAHHAFDLDQEGTDSFAHREAGAKEVVLVSANRWAIQHELENGSEPSFEEMLVKLSPCDLVMVEGYKREPIPKIEIIGPQSNEDYFWTTDPNITALAIDKPLTECNLPQFSRTQITDIMNFILKFHGIQP
jgi:molybdopterin-guanine dinucleotide biosynthesis protein B